MKYRTMLTLFVVAIVIVNSCSKNDPFPPIDNRLTHFQLSSEVMAFAQTPDSTADIWGKTRGIAYSDTIPPMDVYAYYTGHEPYASATAITTFMDKQLVEYTNNTWTYDPPQYWPADREDKISFFSFVPEGKVTNGNTNKNQKPTFIYALRPNVTANDDLLAAVQYDEQRSAHPVHFTLKHALTRVSLKGKLADAIPQNSNETNVRYFVRTVEFHCISRQGEMQFDDVGDISWVIDNPFDTITCTAWQGTTLLPLTTNDNQLTTTEKDLCIENKAIFILPQDVTNAYINLTILKRYKDLTTNTNKTSTYEINNCKVPTAPGSNGAFLPGQWISMTFTFNPNNKDDDNIIDFGDFGQDSPETPADSTRRDEMTDAVVEAIMNGHDTIHIQHIYTKDLIADDGLSTNPDNVFNDIKDSLDAIGYEGTFALDLSQLIRQDGDEKTAWKTVFKHLAPGLFTDNPYIHTLILPWTLYEIYAGSFEGCTNLMSITFGSATEPTYDYNAVNETIQDNIIEGGEYFLIRDGAFDGLPSGCEITIYTTSRMNNTYANNTNEYSPNENTKPNGEDTEEDYLVPIVSQDGENPQYPDDWKSQNVMQYVYTIN